MDISYRHFESTVSWGYSYLLFSLLLFLLGLLLLLLLGLQQSLLSILGEGRGVSRGSTSGGIGTILDKVRHFVIKYCEFGSLDKLN
jgi:hypothetical protein